MTWTDDKEAEHQRIRADFAEERLERLHKAATDVTVAWGVGDNDKLQMALLALFLLVQGKAPDVPRVTDAERAEAQRVREAIE